MSEELSGVMSNRITIKELFRNKHSILDIQMLRTELIRQY